VPDLIDRRSASAALHGRARAMVAAFERGAPMPEPFDALAVDLARFQAAHVAGYARLCAARGIDPRSLENAGEAPAVPTDAFTLTHVFAFDAGEAAVTFRTSGTTLGARGAHPMRDAGTYDAAALGFGRAMLAPDLAGPSPILVVGPSSDAAPDSSLAHMCDLFARRLGTPSSADVHFLVDGELRIDALRVAVRALPPTTPAIVLGTSFGLVHLLDALGGEVLALPAGSRAMQTGGFKGRSREVAPAELRRAIAAAFAVPERAVIGEYGMTELSSQFWEATIARPDARAGVYVEPPWARVVPVDGETLAPVPDGEVGIARVEDLANVDSAWAVLAQDRVRRVPGGFELLGRAPGAPPRGCSIAVDEMLSPAP
jgi:hypothetical protein